MLDADHAETLLWENINKHQLLEVFIFSNQKNAPRPLIVMQIPLIKKSNRIFIQKRKMNKELNENVKIALRDNVGWKNIVNTL